MPEKPHTRRATANAPRSTSKHLRDGIGKRPFPRLKGDAITMEYEASRTCAGLSTALSLRLAAVAANPHSSRNRHNGCGRRRKFLCSFGLPGGDFAGSTVSVETK